MLFLEVVAVLFGTLASWLELLMVCLMAGHLLLELMFLPVIHCSYINDNYKNNDENTFVAERLTSGP